MAYIDNPAKEFQFRITLDGLNPFLAQEVTIPDKDVDVVEHGDSNYLVKTGGMGKVGTLMIDKIMPADSIDRFAWPWLESVQDLDAGGGELPSIYKKMAFIEQLSNDGATTVGSWLCHGVWPHKINGIKFSRTSSNNTTERIELCVDKIRKIQ